MGYYMAKREVDAVVKLGDLITIVSSSKQLDGDLFWLLNLDMVEQQTGNIIEYNYVNKNQLNGSIIQFDSDTLLYSKLRPNLNKVVLPLKDGFATSEMLPIKVDSTQLSKEYLAFYLRSDSFVTWAVSKTAGAKMPRLGTKELLSKYIPLPTLAEQQRISQQFSKLDALISLRKQQLSKLDELVKSRFIEMFGDQDTNPLGWKQCTIGECCTLKSGTTLSAEVENEGGSVPYVKVGDMNFPGNERYITTSSRYVTEETAGKGLFEVGSIIFPKRGGAIGTNKKRMTKLLICADLNVMGVSSNGELLPEYLFAYFDLIDLGELSDGSSVPQINNKNIAPLVICIPPMELQQQFAAFIEQVDKSKFEIQKSLEKLETLKKSLMQKYFG